MKIDSLWRYPVRGLSAEKLALADVQVGQGFAFDRMWAITGDLFIFDHTKPEPMVESHFLLLAPVGRLALLKTGFDPEAPRLDVRTQDVLHSFSLREIEGRRALAEFLTAFIGQPLRRGAEVVHAEGHQFTDVSVNLAAMMLSISLINLSTIRDLGDQVGRTLDPLRFKTNLYFDGASPWSELDWLGKTSRAGEVMLRIVQLTRRFPAMSVDLERGVRDLNIPQSIRDYRGHGDCGVYAGRSAVRTATPHVGQLGKATRRKKGSLQ